MTASPPTSQPALRDRIAAALYERERPPGAPAWADARPADREVFEAMADAVLPAVLPATTNHDTDTSEFELRGDTEIRAAALREAIALLDQRASSIDAFSSSDFGEEARAVRELTDVANELRRVADETAATETPDEAWQREWDRRPDGADVSDLFEIVAVVPCSGTLFSAHQPHTWEPQPGVPAVHCPGERQPAAGARQDGAQQ